MAEAARKAKDAETVGEVVHPWEAVDEVMIRRGDDKFWLTFNDIDSFVRRIGAENCLGAHDQPPPKKSAKSEK